MITVYTTDVSAKLLHLPERDNLIVTAVVGFSNLIWLPLMGVLSDRIGRKPILIVCTVLAITTAYPAMLWVSGAAFSVQAGWRWTLWLSQLSTLRTIPPWSSTLTEIVPESVRAVGFQPGL